jgi:hypothetical protein
MVILHYCGVILRGFSRRMARSIAFHLSLNKLRQARLRASLIAGTENPPMISRAVTFQVNVALRFPVAVQLSAASVCIVPSIIDGEFTHRCSCFYDLVLARDRYRAKGVLHASRRCLEARPGHTPPKHCEHINPHGEYRSDGNGKYTKKIYSPSSNN